MEISKLDLKKIILEKIEFNRIDTIGTIRVESQFSLKVNKSDLKRIKANCNYCLYNNEDAESFLAVEVSGYFVDDENEREEIELESEKDAIELINLLLPDVNSIISDIMEKSYGASLELPNHMDKNEIGEIEK